MSTSTILTPLFCAALSAMVVLHGAHAKELISLSSAGHALKTVDEASKLASDLHHHTDKQTLKTFHPGDAGQLDGRSLRLLRQTNERHHLQLLRDKLGMWWHGVSRFVNLF